MDDTIELSNRDQNSITLKKDSKGNYNYDIKIYFNEDEARAIQRIVDIDKALRERFPNE